MYGEGASNYLNNEQRTYLGALSLVSCIIGLSNTSFIISILAVLYIGISTMKLTRPEDPEAYKGTSCQADLRAPLWGSLFCVV